MLWSNSFKHTVEAIATILVIHRLELDPTDLPGVVEFVLEQYQRMPDYLQLPLGLLTWIFNWNGLFYGGKLFTHASDRAQWQQLQTWQKSWFAPSRDLVRFYESLVVFYGYETSLCAHK